MELETICEHCKKNAIQDGVTYIVYWKETQPKIICADCVDGEFFF